MSTSDTTIFPPLRTSDVLACQFSSWYPLFKRHAPKATIIKPIPQEEEFLEYLESDGLFLPEGSGPNGISELSDSDEEEEEQERDDDSSSTSSDDEPVKQFSFPQLDGEIRSVLSKYEGAVFPKLNWSSPQDAAWMIPGQNLKCQNPADVYLLLKSSDFISHDLDHAFDECVDFDPTSLVSPPLAVSSDEPETSSSRQNTPDFSSLSLEDSTSPLSPSPPSSPSKRIRRPYSFELVLKKWFDMPKSQEWRCFIRDNELIGISQRDTTFYDFLQPENVRRQLVEQISSFWSNTVKDGFPSSNYTLDVYLTRDQSKTFIIDFNPYSPSTDPLLFTYPELSTLSTSSSTPVLRIVESEAAGVLPRYSHNRYPKDVVELSEGQSVAEFAKVWGEKLKDATIGDEGEGKTSEEKKVEELVGR